MEACWKSAREKRGGGKERGSRDGELPKGGARALPAKFVKEKKGARCWPNDRQNHHLKGRHVLPGVASKEL